MAKRKAKRCKAICRDGKRCSHDAVIGGYCIVHYKMSRGINYISKKPKEEGDKDV